MKQRLALCALAVAVLTTFGAARRRAVVLPPSGPVPTFNRDVARILQDNCQSCHHPGDIAPFSLMTYGDAIAHAGDMKYMTSSRQMPPWKPVTGCGEFDQARVMTQSEIETIAKWVDGGTPEGNPADLPAPRDFSSGWILGQPDLVASNAESYTPPASGDMYRCFTMPANTTEDKYVSAIDIHPGDRKTVHHVIAFIDTSGESQKLDEADPQPGYKCFGGPGFAITNPDSASLGGWVPGARPVMLPEEVAMKLPANARIVLQVHYHPHDPNPVPDKTEIALYYAKKTPQKILRILPLANTTFTIPPGDANFRVTQALPGLFVPNIHLYVIAPHMHLLGKRMKVDALLPNGESMCLINIEDWDFNWQGLYRYKEPIAIPAGTTVAMTAFFDNSEANWRNPNNPPKPVSWGEATTDEMAIAFLGFTVDGENVIAGEKADVSWWNKARQ
ncbi:MAG: ascorbate-dependent monooxygenase [Thermoanaerobaculia bacterium]